MGRRTMYAMMGAGGYGCPGVSPPLIAHLWKVFALPRILYGLEVFCLSLKDVMQLEQVQRFFMKRIQCLPVNTISLLIQQLRQPMAYSVQDRSNKN